MLYGYEPFSVFEDQIQGVAAVPQTSNTVNVALLPLQNTNLISDLDFIFTFKGTTNAYTTTVAASDFFPYLFVAKLAVPYQSGALKIWEDIDGHMAYVINSLRKTNRRLPDYRFSADQIYPFTTGYSAASGDIYSASNYTVSASGTPSYSFRLRVPVAQYFLTYLDKIEAPEAQGQAPKVQINPYSDVYVNWLAMASTGRNVTPIVQLNPVYGSLGNKSPITTTGAGTAPAWTDTGSTVTVRRDGIYTPAEGITPPPSFPWAPNWKQVNFPIGSSKLTIPIPAEGQLLCMIMRFFDPTLNSGVGGAIPLTNLQNAAGSPAFLFKVGSGIVRYADSYTSIKERILWQHGNNLTKGVAVWDFYAEEKSNGSYVVDTYEVSSPTAVVDFDGNTPGSGSICDVAFQYLTGIA